MGCTDFTQVQKPRLVDEVGTRQAYAAASANVSICQHRPRHIWRQICQPKHGSIKRTGDCKALVNLDFPQQSINPETPNMFLASNFHLFGTQNIDLGYMVCPKMWRLGIHSNLLYIMAPLDLMNILRHAPSLSSIFISLELLVSPHVELLFTPRR